jgi:flagella basal body P-ring formation protein FlgA
MMLFLMLAAALPASACSSIEHDRILGRDLAAAVPALQGLAPDSDWGPAPSPGSKRLFEVRELKRIALTAKVQADFSSGACFTWTTKPLDPEALKNAMKKAVAPRNVAIELVDHSLWPAPEGEISFPISSLSLGSDGTALWHGYVTYSNTRRFDIWARARLTVKETHFFTTDKIASARAISLADLRSELYEGALTREEPITDAQQAVGLIARFDLPSGTLLTRRVLDYPHDVERGDTLTVTVQTGHARVEAQCIADESGRAGYTIAVHNARSGRHFRALLQAKGKAIVASSDALGLVATAEDIRP